MPFTSHRSLFTTPSRHRQASEYSVDYRLAGDRLRLRLIADDDAVAQDIGADALYVLRRNVATAIQKRVGPSSEREVNCGPRRRAITNQSVHLQVVSARIARGPDHIDD